MIVAARDGTALNLRRDGPSGGRPVLLLHELGTDLTLWDRVVPLLDPRLFVVRVDLRGHGASGVAAPPYGMGTLVGDAETVADGLGLRGAAVVGLGLGGLVAQGLAVKRPDIAGALVLSGSAARIGLTAQWDRAIAAVAAGGMAAVADDTVARWFARDHRGGALAAHWRARLLACDPAGWRGAAAAMAGADFWTVTAGLTLPLLAIAGSEDGVTPADLVRETADLVAGAEIRIIRRTGHLPPVEDPAAWAETVQDFLDRTGHRAEG